MTHKKIDIGTIVSYIIILFLAAISLIPILWMISTAFKARNMVFAWPPQWIPNPITLENFQRVLTTVPFAQYFKNSMLITLAVVFGQLLLGMPAAYGFSRLHFKGRDTMFALMLSGLMVPQIVLMIPQYMMMQKLNLVDTYAAVILPQIFTNVFNIFLMKQFFAGIPKEYEEAAKIDGAGTLRIFVSIVLPQSKSIVATVCVMSFLRAWNNFLWPLIVINNPQKQVLTVGLQTLQGQFVSDWSGIMAGATITLLPMLLVYLVAQKYFVQSIQLSGIK